LLDCFFLTAFFGGFACFLRRLFFARFVATVFDFVCFLLAFFLLEGMAAVYHWGGIVIREVHQAAPRGQIVATDINPAMLEFATHALRSEHVSFRPADAQDLPSAEGFDLVLCQFGVIVFPDKIRANQEAHRMLRPNGHYLLVIFNGLS
jgi:SAM-dependent methyltransferase